MEETYVLTMWCPVYRGRDPDLGFRAELENLDGDAKGKGASGGPREAESTDASDRGGLLRSSDEAGVMPVERRERVTRVGIDGSTGNRRSPWCRRKTAVFSGWHEPDMSRGLSPVL